MVIKDKVFWRGFLTGGFIILASGKSNLNSFSFGLKPIFNLWAEAHSNSWFGGNLKAKIGLR